MRLLSNPSERDFWEICEHRDLVRSTILNSQSPFSRRHEAAIRDSCLDVYSRLFLMTPGRAARRLSAQFAHHHLPCSGAADDSGGMRASARQGGH
jgi:hypothetical protein